MTTGVKQEMLPVLKGIKKVKKRPRKLPLDAIYTAGIIGGSAIKEPTSSLVHCCMAVRSGWKYGVQSSNSVCACHDIVGGHEICFIDNNYFNYDHELHMASVKKWKPKYATVMDVMTRPQCAKDGIKWYSLARVLAWAEEISEYAENVIVIPKYDCLDSIPEKYILGYSVPTSHGGTPLPVELFKGRRVHLLGGSWKAQLDHMVILGDDVVSIDNNYILLTAQYGTFTDGKGNSYNLSDVGIGNITNPMYAALSLSLGYIAAEVNKMVAREGTGDSTRWSDPEVRLATEADIDHIKQVADGHKEELGFVMRPALEGATEKGWLLYHPPSGSFCNFRNRRDGVTVIYEVCVPEEYRGGGLGRRMINMLHRPVQLKCPVDNESNGFYERVGFKLVGREDGKKRELNVWRLE